MLATGTAFKLTLTFAAPALSSTEASATEIWATVVLLTSVLYELEPN